MKQQLNSERRDSDRYAVRGLVCDAGTLTDLSTTGAAVERQTPWPVGQVRTVMIRGGEKQIRVEAECLHSEPAGDDRHHLGLRFLNPDAEQRAALAELAVMHAGY